MGIDSNHDARDLEMICDEPSSVSLVLVRGRWFAHRRLHDRSVRQRPGRWPHQRETMTGRCHRGNGANRRFVSGRGDRRRQTDRSPCDARAAPPLVRPTRENSDGALWAWRSTGRPIAIMAIELYPHDRAFGTVWALEFTSLSTGAIELEGGTHFDQSYPDLAPPLPGGRLRWAPQKGDWSSTRSTMRRRLRRPKPSACGR